MTDNLLRVIGIDPGPTPGLVALYFHKKTTLVEVDVAQCSWSLAETLLEAILNDADIPTLLQIEKFVVSNRAGRSAHAQAGGLTRALIPMLFGVLDKWRNAAGGEVMLMSRWFERSASQVKPWATDTRLEAAGLLDATKGMRHAKDAARHALFAACHDCRVPDPLSKRSKTDG